MKRMFIGFALAFLLSTSAFAADSSRAVALKAITALIFERDTEKVKLYISKDAERKNGGPGSLLKAMDGREHSVPGAISKIVFFDQSDVDALAKDYPDDMWPRLQKRLDVGLGVLIVVKLDGEIAKRAEAAGRLPVGLLALLIKEVEGQQQIVYADDN